IGLFNTSDGGKTWQLFVPPASELGSFTGAEANLADTYFATVTRGWIVKSGKESWTWQTEDGGSTWRPWRAGAMKEVFFLDDGHGWAGVAMDRGGQENYWTSDWGKSWTACG